MNIRFVDDPHDIESSDSASILGGLSLGVVKVSRHCDYGMSDCVTEVSLGCLLHLYKYHGTDLLGCKETFLSLHIDLDVRFLVLFSHGEWKILDVFLYSWIVPGSANQTLGVKDSVLWVGGELIFSRISDQTLALGCECHVGGGDSVTLVISNDLNTSILVHTNTGGENLQEDNFPLKVRINNYLTHKFTGSEH